MLTFNEQEVKDLDKFIQEMPTKYGFPLLNFINAKIQEQAKAVVPEVQVEEQ